MTSSSSTPFWNYSHNFQKEPAKVSFHENFLGLARAYKECEFDGEVARLVKTLQDVPAGYAFCTGGLGSGKTTTVHNIVKAILFGTVENIDISDPDAEQWETSEAPADAIPQYEVVPTPSGANLECGMYAIVKSMSHQLPDHAPSIDDLRDLLNGPEMTERMAPLFDIGQSNLTADQIAAVLQLWGDQRGIVLRLNVIVEGDQLQVIFPTDDCTTIWIHNDNAVELSGTDFNHYSGVKLAAATSPSTELDLAQQVLQSLTHIQGMVSVPALDVDEEAPAPLTEYEEPELGEYKKAEGFVSAKDTAGNSFDQSSNKPRVAWIAAQNKVVNNAAHCAFLQCLTLALISITIIAGLILIITLNNLFDILILLNLAKPSHSIAEVLAHGVLVFVRLRKNILTTGTVLLDPLGAREVNTWRVQNISLDAIVISDWFGSRCIWSSSARGQLRVA
ncbi:hypothetical protein FOMA001_g8232 [Fusarium oxysporum f. sp. matthiolae]|nr:hypothetical protein FOMA001_g8232 [Fusarium oxysporum f. sp. matthiolae]